jgi:hypothetical protein
MELARSLKMFVTTQMNTRCHNTNDHNPKSYEDICKLFLLLFHTAIYIKIAVCANFKNLVKLVVPVSVVLCKIIFWFVLFDIALCSCGAMMAYLVYVCVCVGLEARQLLWLFVLYTLEGI